MVIAAILGNEGAVTQASTHLSDSGVSGLPFIFYRRRAIDASHDSDSTGNINHARRPLTGRTAMQRVGCLGRVTHCPWPAMYSLSTRITMPSARVHRRWQHGDLAHSALAAKSVRGSSSPQQPRLSSRRSPRMPCWQYSRAPWAPVFQPQKREQSRLPIEQRGTIMNTIHRNLPSYPPASPAMLVSQPASMYWFQLQRGLPPVDLPGAGRAGAALPWRHL